MFVPLISVILYGTGKFLGLLSLTFGYRKNVFLINEI